MKRINLKMNNKAITLLETVLALTITSVVLVTITELVAVSNKSFKDNTDSSVLQQHARVAMDRIMWELRYASVLNSVGTTLSFGTANIWDTDSGVETFVYDKPTQSIMREVIDDNAVTVSGPLDIAGIVGSNTIDRVTAITFTSTGMKIDGSNNLVPLAGGDPLSLAVAVRVDIILADDDGQSLTLSSVARMRNL